MSDSKVKHWITAALRKAPDMSASGLLRRFRDDGFACEQSRFSRLHRECKASLAADDALFAADDATRVTRAVPGEGMTVKHTEFTPPRRALRIIQGGGTPVYLFSLTAGEILQVAEISRVGRGDHSELIGYQRPEVRQHVKEIMDYLDGDDVLFPNPIIIALPSTVRWKGSRGPNVSDGIAEGGTIEIPSAGPGEASRAGSWTVNSGHSRCPGPGGRTSLSP